MKRLRTLVVVHSTLVPPDTLEGHSEKEIEEWRTEYDVVSTLKKSGHEVRCLGISDSVEELRSVITEWKPEMVFNLLEEFDGIVTYDQHVVAFLELLRQPYTGCNPRGLLLARDKPLCKQLLSYHRISSPQFAVFRRGIKLRLPRKIKYPLFVKSTTEDASLGISQASIVTDKAQLKQRIQFVHDQVQTDALVEEYIEGRELYVGVMGNDRLTRLPVWEMKFGSLPETSAGIATRRVKWDKKYQKKHGIDTHEAKDLPPAVVATARQTIAPRLSLAGSLGMRAHRLPHERRGPDLRDRSQSEPQPRGRRRLRAVGARPRESVIPSCSKNCLRSARVIRQSGALITAERSVMKTTLQCRAGALALVAVSRPCSPAASTSSSKTSRRSTNSSETRLANIEATVARSCSSCRCARAW